MHMDVIGLRAFYAQPLGLLTRRLIRLQVQRHMHGFAGMNVAGLGFATPYLRPYFAESERVVALMPAGQGVMHWPPEGPFATTLVDEDVLPIADQSIDRMLVVHALEMTDSPSDVLRDIWRVLAPGGRLIVIVPNRRGLWARFDNTPFGFGRPFSRTQLGVLLKDSMFAPEAWSETLFLPPISSRSILRLSGFFERMGRLVSVPTGGVIAVEASKQVFQPIRQRKERRLGVRIGPVLTPRPATYAGSSPRRLTSKP